MKPSTWTPFFVVLPRRIGGRWRWLELVQRRLVFEPGPTPQSWRGVEEFC